MFWFWKTGFSCYRDALWFNVWGICGQHCLVGPPCCGPSATPFPRASQNSFAADDTHRQWLTGSSWTTKSCEGWLTPKVHTRESKIRLVSLLSLIFISYRRNYSFLFLVSYNLLKFKSIIILYRKMRQEPKKRNHPTAALWDK